MNECLLSETLLHTFPSALLVFDARGVVIKNNEQWEHLAEILDLTEFGSTVNDLAVETGILLLAPGERERVQEISRKAKSLLVRQRICTIGRTEYTALLIDDITGFRETMSSVTRNTLSALWKIRSRTTGIQNALSLLTEYSSNSLCEEDLALLQDSLFETWQLTRYCNNLRDVSGLKSGIIEIIFESCNLKQAVTAAIGNVTVYTGYQHRKCHISTSIPEAITVHCDWGRLVHILDAVILNSVIYSTGEISIDITVHCEGDQVLLSIKDQGMGFDTDELAQVFSPEFRGSNASRVQYNGMGMELYLARQLLMRMHGAIYISSKQGIGTNVDIALMREKE